jgi:hypothetical protein
VDLEKSGKNIFDLGYTSLMQPFKTTETEGVDITSYSDSAEYLESVKIDDVLSGASSATLSGSVYSSTTTIYFKKPFHRPPVCLGFVKSNNTNYLMPRHSLELSIGLIGGIFNGYVCTKWSRMSIFKDRVVIKTYSNADFDEDYLIYVLYE